MKRLGLKFAAAAAAAIFLSGCDLIAQLPLVKPDPIGFGSRTVGKVLTATITKNNARLDGSEFTVTCEVSLQVTPARATGATLTAVQGSGNSWSCALPTALNAMVHPNQQINVQWLVAAGGRTLGDSGVQSATLDCPSPLPALRAEQAAVMGAFPAPMTFAQIVAAGFVPTHGAASTRGMGVAFMRMSSVGSDLAGSLESAMANLPAPTFGTPDILLFMPSGSGSAVEDQLPEPSYTLIGWAYGQSIRIRSAKPLPPSGGRAALDPRPVQPRPVLPCVPHHQWFVHASGIHHPTGAFTPAAVPPPVPAVFHPDIWDIHFFAGADGTPRMAIDDPVRSVPGLASPRNAFYYTTAYD